MGNDLVRDYHLDCSKVRTAYRFTIVKSQKKQYLLPCTKIMPHNLCVTYRARHHNYFQIFWRKNKWVSHQREAARTPLDPIQGYRILRTPWSRQTHLARTQYETFNNMAILSVFSTHPLIRSRSQRETHRTCRSITDSRTPLILSLPIPFSQESKNVLYRHLFTSTLYSYHTIQTYSKV